MLSVARVADIFRSVITDGTDGVLSGGRRIVDFNCNGTEYWRRI